MFNGTFKNIALTLSGSLIREAQKPEYLEKNYLPTSAELGISRVIVEKALIFFVCKSACEYYWDMTITLQLEMMMPLE